MKEVWFKKWGWSYLPVNPIGYLITVLAIIFMVPVVWAIDRNAYSVSDELYEIFIYATCTAVWWKRTAEKTSK